MNRYVVSCLIGMSLCACGAAQERLPRNAKYPQWISDYPAALKVARESGKPLFVVLRCEP